MHRHADLGNCGLLARRMPRRGNALSHWPPFSSGGALYTTSNWCVALQGLCDCTERVETLIKSELTGGNVQEAFCHLKGWYWSTSEIQAKPCFQTMECQTLERVNSYVRRMSPGDPLPINVERIEINDDAPSDGELQIAASELSNGRTAGASRMRAEHIKEWLQGIRQEEDPERLPYKPGSKNQ